MMNSKGGSLQPEDYRRRQRTQSFAQITVCSIKSAFIISFITTNYVADRFLYCILYKANKELYILAWLGADRDVRMDNSDDDDQRLTADDHD